MQNTLWECNFNSLRQSFHKLRFLPFVLFPWFGFLYWGLLACDILAAVAVLNYPCDKQLGLYFCRMCQLITAHGLNLASVCFLMACKLRVVFPFSYGWKKKIHHMWKFIWNSNLSIHKVWNTAPHSALGTIISVAASGPAAAELSSFDRPSLAHSSLHTKGQHNAHCSNTVRMQGFVSPIWEDPFKDAMHKISLQISINRWTFAVDGDCRLEHLREMSPTPKESRLLF